MSVVTGIMLCTACTEEYHNFERIEEWLKQRGMTPLHSVDDICCNGKHPQMLMRGGGYNCFPNDEFANFVLSLPWDRPENVILVMQPEDGATLVFWPLWKDGHDFTSGNGNLTGRRENKKGVK